MLIISKIKNLMLKLYSYIKKVPKWIWGLVLVVISIIYFFPRKKIVTKQKTEALNELIEVTNRRSDALADVTDKYSDKKDEVSAKYDEKINKLNHKANELDRELNKGPVEVANQWNKRIKAKKKEE